MKRKIYVCASQNIILEGNVEVSQPADIQYEVDVSDLPEAEFKKLAKQRNDWTPTWKDDKIILKDKHNKHADFELPAVKRINDVNQISVS